MFRRYVALLVAICGLGILCAPSAAADSPAPGWEVFTRTAPTDLPPGGIGELWIYAYNVGGAPSAGATVVDTLPPGVTAISDEARHASCSGKTVVTCTPALSQGTFGAGELADHETGILIPVKVAAGVEGTGVNRVTVSGGGAATAASRSTPITFGTAAPGLGFAGLDAWFSNADGTLDTQAGSHPYELTVAFAFNSTGHGIFNEFPAGGEARHVNVNLPPGIIGDPRAVPQCTLGEFDREASGQDGCPAATQVGEDVTNIEGEPFVFPVYNMVPPPGVPAQFAFTAFGINTFLDAGVRSGGDYGITQHTSDLPQRYIVFNSTTIWGVPAEASHDHRRFSVNTRETCPNGCAAGVPVKPFLTLPTACTGPLTFSAEVRGTYQDEDATASTSVLSQDDQGNPTGLQGCDLLGHFNPEVSVAPDTGAADTPAGLAAEVNLPQEDEQGLLEPEKLSSADLKNTAVTLPAGVAINPGQATGLVACQPSEEAVGTEGPGTEDPATCPAASKVGEDELETPILPNRLRGNVYILQSNPPNVQILVTASGEGVNLKLVGDVHLNEATGQLTTTFNETPEVPFTHFKLAFSGGAQAALVTPTSCGVYSSNADFTPWNTPFGPDFLESSSFAITGGPDGTACQSPLPFTPTLTAGATTDQAGGYTDFSVLLQRPDGQQRIGNLQFKTPEGLLGMISKVPLCPEPQAGRGECSSASQIGHTVVGAGPGPYPLFIPQAGQPPAPIYLTGPYKGAPYGLSIVVPIVAGPFTLETQVVRARIEVDPHTAQLTITTDPLPAIVDGIPADLRSINAVIDKPEFMFNPTSCAPMSFSGTATSTEGASAALGSHFQVGSCQALKFQPNFKVSTQAHTSRADGASLDAKIVYPTGNLGDNQASSQSNIQTVKVELPKRLPSRLTTLQKACPAAVFEANPANCPAASAVGHATAITPVLPVALTGPAYFVSHGDEAFPSLIVVLQGYGVTVDLVGTTFISKSGITSSTFKQVPDVPIGSFELVLPEGPFSALAANGNLCKGSLAIPTEFTGQNGAFLKQTTKMTVSGCPKAKQAAKQKTKGKRTKGKRKANGRAKRKSKGGQARGRRKG
jgi:hypothetical protein